MSVMKELDDLLDDAMTKIWIYDDDINFVNDWCMQEQLFAEWMGWC